MPSTSSCLFLEKTFKKRKESEKALKRGNHNFDHHQHQHDIIILKKLQSKVRTVIYLEIVLLQNIFRMAGKLDFYF
jgi:hypothetical protein